MKDLKYFKVFLKFLALISLASCKEVNETSCSKKEEFTVFPNSEIVEGKVSILGNTGLAFDAKLKLLVHSRYNYSESNKVVFTDYEGNVKQTFNVNHLINHIQGVTYNWDNDTFWIWGTAPDSTPIPWSDSMILIEIDRELNKLSETTLPSHMNYPGMLAYSGNGTIWVKANTSSIAYQLRTDTWELIDTLETHVRGEGIAYNRLDGSIWLHDGKKVFRIDPKNLENIMEWPSPVSNERSEDVAIDSLGRVWISADEGLASIDGEGNPIVSTNKALIPLPDGNKVWAVVCSKNYKLTQ